MDPNSNWFQKKFVGQNAMLYFMVIIAVLFSLKNMTLGFDFLGFQAIKRFPTKNRIFLHVMQFTITKNSFLLVF